MLKSNRWMVTLGVLALGAILVGCTTPEAETIIQTVEVDVAGETIVVTAAPEPEVEGEKTMIICQGQEPDTLYLYGGDMLASAQIQEAIYDGTGGRGDTGGIDLNTFGYHETFLEKIPSLSDDDAVINAVTASEGDTVADHEGNPVTLEEGVRIRPAGCSGDDCELDYAGGDVEMDQMVVDFTMKPGLTWEDGTPATSSDAVFAYNLNLDPDTPESKFNVERTASYEANGDLGTVWTGIPGWIDSTYFQNFWGPLPEHEWSSFTALELIEAEESSRTPLSYGPFKIDEWVAGSHLTVSKNPTYYLADEGLPKLDKIIFRFDIGEHPNTAIAAMAAGECDIIDQTTHPEDQLELLAEMEAAGVLKPEFVEGTVWEHVDFGITPVDSYDRPDFFGDLRVRKAIAMCLDRQAMADAIFFGKAGVLHSYIPEVHPMYAEDVVIYPYDVDAANALLEEVGWVDSDGDGVREASGGIPGVPDGTLLSFKWQSTTADLRVTYMQIAKEQLTSCGIDVITEHLPAGEYFADGPEGPLFGRHFDLGSFAWLTGVEPPCDLYLTSEIPSEERGWGASNDPGFSNAEYDVACLAALGSLPGTPEYEQFHKQAQVIFSENLPAVPIFPRLKIAVAGPNVLGFIMDPTNNSEMWNIENFDLE